MPRRPSRLCSGATLGSIAIRPLSLFAASLALAGCTQLPDLGASDTGRAPPILPLDALLEGTADPAAAGQLATAPLEARAAALRARAAILRRPVTSDGDLDRLRADLANAN